MYITVYLNQMQTAQPADFWFWFASEAVGAVFVVVLLYVFFVRNPKINKRYENKRHHQNQSESD